MPKTYEDLKEMKLGRQANIQQEADNQIENELAQKDREIAMQEGQQQEQFAGSIQEDAIQIVAEMDQAQENGQDPMEIYEQLRPEMQEAIAQIMQQEGQPQDEEMRDIPPQQNQGNVQEQNDSIMQMASQLLSQ